MPADDEAIWPELLPVLSLLAQVSTQWRVAPMGGLIGLDYAAVYPLLDIFEVPPDQRRQWLADLRVMEGAVLAVVNAD